MFQISEDQIESGGRDYAKSSNDHVTLLMLVVKMVLIG